MNKQSNPCRDLKQIIKNTKQQARRTKNFYLIARDNEKMDYTIYTYYTGRENEIWPNETIVGLVVLVYPLNGGTPTAEFLPEYQAVEEKYLRPTTPYASCREINVRARINARLPEKGFALNIENMEKVRACVDVNDIKKALSAKLDDIIDNAILKADEGEDCKGGHLLPERTACATCAHNSAMAPAAHVHCEHKAPQPTRCMRAGDGYLVAVTCDTYEAAKPATDAEDASAAKCWTCAHNRTLAPELTGDRAHVVCALDVPRPTKCTMCSFGLVAMECGTYEPKETAGQDSEPPANEEVINLCQTCVHNQAMDPKAYTCCDIGCSGVTHTQRIPSGTLAICSCEDYTPCEDTDLCQTCVHNKAKTPKTGLACKFACSGITKTLSTNSGDLLTFSCEDYTPRQEPTKKEENSDE